MPQLQLSCCNRLFQLRDLKFMLARLSCPAPVFAGDLRSRNAAIASDGFAVETGGQPIAVTVSTGLAESAGDSSAALLSRADRALYRSKQDGRNRVSVDHARD
jgi:GGDEF domain-containing protein